MVEEQEGQVGAPGGQVVDDEHCKMPCSTSAQECVDKHFRLPRKVFRKIT